VNTEGVDLREVIAEFFEYLYVKVAELLKKVLYGVLLLLVDKGEDGASKSMKEMRRSYQPLRNQQTLNLSSFRKVPCWPWPSLPNPTVDVGPNDLVVPFVGILHEGLAGRTMGASGGGYILPLDAEHVLDWPLLGGHHVGLVNKGAATLSGLTAGANMVCSEPVICQTAFF
jgi:hypothetical protein